MIVVQSQYCPQNHPCPTLRACPVGAIKQDGYNAPTIDADLCIECGRCVASCPVFKSMPTPVGTAGKAARMAENNGDSRTGDASRRRGGM